MGTDTSKYMCSTGTPLIRDATIVMSYNTVGCPPRTLYTEWGSPIGELDVNGYYPEGVYGYGKLVVIKYHKPFNESSSVVEKELIEKMKHFFGKFDVNADGKKIKNIFVYCGNMYPPTRDLKLDDVVAYVIGKDFRMKVNMLTCSCSDLMRPKFERSCYISLKCHCRCGGHDEMKVVADTVLGIKRTYEGDLFEIQRIKTQV